MHKMNILMQLDVKEIAKVAFCIGFSDCKADLLLY